MSRRTLLVSFVGWLAVALLLHPRTGAVAAAAAGGTIKGRVILSGPAPGNTIIRMGMDPKCSAMNAGARVVDQSVRLSKDGGVADVFVEVQGQFPATLVPAEPVVIDQRRCIYGPRVVGMRLGQTLRIRNDDDVFHDVHTSSAVGNAFTASQPKAGIVSEFKPKAAEMMLKLGCDIHRWMVAYVGVVTHPYFAVSDPSGAFEIHNVPPGTYMMHMWHERLGQFDKRVTVTAGQTADATLTYAQSRR